jgi:hypothetical protein
MPQARALVWTASLFEQFGQTPDIRRVAGKNGKVVRGPFPPWPIRHADEIPNTKLTISFARQVRGRLCLFSPAWSLRCSLVLGLHVVTCSGGPKRPSRYCRPLRLHLLWGRTPVPFPHRR